MFGGILLFRFQVRLLVYALVIPGKLLESLAAQLWLVLGDERAPCACIELLDRLIPHAPVIFNMNKADKIAVGLFRANILAVISRNPSREEGSLFLLKHLRSHLEHHRRQDGVRTSVDLGRVFHEILDGDFDLKVVAILGKGIEKIFKKSAESYIAMSCCITGDRFIIRQFFSIGKGKLFIRDRCTGKPDIHRRFNISVLFCHIQI